MLNHLFHTYRRYTYYKARHCHHNTHTHTTRPHGAASIFFILVPLSEKQPDVDLKPCLGLCRPLFGNFGTELNHGRWPLYTTRAMGTKNSTTNHANMFLEQNTAPRAGGVYSWFAFEHGKPTHHHRAGNRAMPVSIGKPGKSRITIGIPVVYTAAARIYVLNPKRHYEKPT